MKKHFPEEDLLKEEYFVNLKEYQKLLSKGVINPSLWDLRSLLITKEINGLFEENNFIYRLLFDCGYRKLLSDVDSQDGSFGDFEILDFDHYSGVSFKRNVCNLNCADTVTGIMNFPYLNWEEVGEWISKAPKHWGVYIINPCLLNYHFNAIGLFLTPTYYNDVYITLCNWYIVSVTGYPLFLKYSSESEVEPIEGYPLLSVNSVEDFVEKLLSFSDDKCLKKLLYFWRDNDCVSSVDLDNNYECFKEFQPYYGWTDINFIRLVSELPFELVHEDTGRSLGCFKEFSLDKSFKVIDTEFGEKSLDDEELKDLLEGKYNFVLVE